MDLRPKVEIACLASKGETIMAGRKLEIVGNDYHLDNGEVLKPAQIGLLRGEIARSDRRCISTVAPKLPKLKVIPEQTDIDKAGKDLWNPDLRKEDLGF